MNLYARLHCDVHFLLTFFFFAHRESTNKHTRAFFQSLFLCFLILVVFMFHSIALVAVFGLYFIRIFAVSFYSRSWSDWIEFCARSKLKCLTQMKDKHHARCVTNFRILFRYKRREKTQDLLAFYKKRTLKQNYWSKCRNINERLS